MNPKGIFPGNGDADESGPVAETQFATLDVESGLTRQRVIPDYELLRRVGRGSYGEVFLARNLTGSFIAVKVVTRAAFDHERPFEREFEGIKNFEPVSRSDPSQVAILHVGRGEGFFYYAMELADDWTTECAARDAQLYCPHTLREDLKRRGHLPVSECVEIGLALTRALAHLHHHGLVHRDVKPSNVIFVSGVPKLADIGLMTSIDSTRSLVGTDGYAAPEGPGAPQADLYSLGKLLYEISTGCDRKQFPALPPDITDRPDRDALIELNAIIMRACQFDPRDRYTDAEMMLAELELVQRGHSVQRKRSLGRYMASAKKFGMALVALAVVAGGVAILSRALAPSDLSADGPPSTNLVANMLCAKALLIVQEDNYAEFADAYTNFQQAIRLDPHFARPYVGLFDLRLRHRVPTVAAMTPEELRRIAGKLKELAPDLGATWLAQSVISYNDLDFPAARRSAMQAIKADPRYELGHIWYGFMLMNWGWPIEGRAQADISQTLAPSKATSYRLRGHTYYLQRDFTNAIAWYRQAIEMDRHEAVAHQCIACALRAMGDYPGAIDTFETFELTNTKNESETRERYNGLRQAFNDGGARGYWEEEWKRAQNSPDAGFYWKSVVQIHLGNTNAALTWLEESWAAKERDGFESPLIGLLFDSSWDGLRNNPRFKKLLDEVGFTQVMPRQP
jgi:tetratricopeptide (TPR) repeat protein